MAAKIRLTSVNLTAAYGSGRVCLTYAEYVRVRLVGRGLGNSPGCSAARSQTRLPSRRNGNDSDSGPERGDRRDGFAADDSSGSAMVTTCDAKICVSLLSELQMPAEDDL